MMISTLLRLRRLCLLVTTMSMFAAAQSTDPGSGQTPTAPEGWDASGYTVHQTVEIGYRGSDVSGSQDMYDSLVNLRSGPRFLEQSLTMQSIDHTGVLFDNLSINSFGWGGDPNNALRARIDKSKWYDFRASFRRDQTDFDFNLLANPLNTPNSSPSVPVLDSPHGFFTRRRMQDYDLTILPESVVDFRLGYSHNNMSGPSYSSVHEGTDALLYQNWNTTLNSFRAGIDVKLAPRTVLSYDQFLDYYKGDSNWQLAPFFQAFLPGGTQTVELGLPVATAGKTPCAINPPNTSLIDPTGTLTNTACNAYFDYNRTNRIRTTTPTERLSFHSSYFDRLDFSASYAYSSADMDAPFNEFFNGLSQRSGVRQETLTGPAHASRISNVADFSATFHISKQFKFVDTFRLWAFRTPESFAGTDTSWVCNDSSNCYLLTPMSATTPSAETINDNLSFNQRWTTNESDLVWDGSKHYGGRIGFRYGNQIFHHILDFTTGDEDRIEVHQYTPLVGFWLRPSMNMRFNFDWERQSSDDTIVRIAPRVQSRYRIMANYTPKPWAVLSANVNLWDGSNGDSLIDFSGHNRNYGVSATITPRESFSLDFAYNYNDFEQNAFVCFNNSDTTLPVVTTAGSCTANGYDDSGNPLLTFGYYKNHVHYAMGSILFRPLKRVTTQLGYSINSVGGSIPQFNSLQPLGALQYNYHQPLASLAVDLGHNITAKGGWNYYQYGEKSFIGPTDNRYFHANNATASLRWSF
ncbi:hypothetical protein [Candidatus Korobacter versatilis]|nr:hypothetical protein [Candidatus Koribacter versatilis]